MKSILVTLLIVAAFFCIVAPLAQSPFGWVLVVFSSAILAPAAYMLGVTLSES